MKTVILFRHGKSDWKTNYGRDHDRPLARRGIKAAKKMGVYLSNIQEIPDLIISSTALRAKTTAELALKSGGWSSQLILERNIYGSSINDLIYILNQQNPKINIICLVGHEPTFSSFLTYSTNSPCPKFPTASMARIDFKTNIWKEISFGKGILAWMIKPKELD